MDNQKTQNYGSGSVQLKQDKPSHMNQGNRTFHPDDQKKQQPASEHGEKQRGMQHQEEPTRKAS